MATVCFYQDGRHEKPLFWIKRILGIGFISRRKDGMTELRINGFKQVKEILQKLMPFIRFKREQAKALYGAVSLLNQKETRLLDKKDLLKLVNFIITIQKNNYIARKKKTKADIFKILGLTP